MSVLWYYLLWISIFIPFSMTYMIIKRCGNSCITPSLVQFLCQPQILILEIFNMFLRLKFLSFLNPDKNGSSLKISYILRILLFIFFVGLVPSIVCANSPSAGKKPALLIDRANKCRKSLYHSAGKKYRCNWLKCINLYRQIYTSYPKSVQAPWALYYAARLYTGLYKYSKKQGDIDQALLLCKKLAEQYTGYRLADDAQYMIGDIYYRYKKDPTRAYLEFLKVEIRFPSGDMRPIAQKRLDHLSVILSKRREKKRLKTSKRAARVKDIRHWSTDSYTRVVIDVDSPVQYKRFLLKKDKIHKKPPRLYLDLKHTIIPSKVDKEFPIKDGLLKRVRAGQYSKDTVRVTLDLQKIGSFNVFSLHDPFRIVVDARKVNQKEKKGGHKSHAPPKLHVKKRRVRKGIRRTKVKDRTVSLARQLGLNVNTIVIDPGHGGKDPGCLLSRRMEEKNIVLSLAKILAKKIKKEIGCRVILTRNRDVFIPLERRTAIANMKKADLFISLHVNAHRNRNVSGIETYFLNMATDQNAIMVAARENATSERNISDLQSILNDLMLNTKLHESNRLAHCIQEKTVVTLRRRYRRVNSLGVKQAPFYVLIGAQMPAVLIETGFLTNRRERSRLLNRTYQYNLAEGICRGIKDYIKSINHVAYISP